MFASRKKTKQSMIINYETLPGRLHLSEKLQPAIFGRSNILAERLQKCITTENFMFHCETLQCSLILGNMDEAFYD